jgi:exosortase A
VSAQLDPSQATPVVPAGHAMPGGSADLAARAWRQAMVFLIGLLGLALALYWRTASEMAGIWWRSDTFAHAMLVPPLVGWLVWRERARWLHLPPRPTAWAVPAVALAAALWWVGDLVQSNVLTQFALVLQLVACVVGVLGLQVARVIWFPLAFAFFSVPAGDALVPLMMEGTADFTVTALRLTGIPVYREGLQFVIPSGNWSVVEACSGVRYLIASFMVGTLFAFLVYQTPWRRLAFMAVSVLVPVLANWVRAYLIVLVGHLSSNTVATGVDHLVYGWVFFGIVMMLTYWVGARWSEAEPGVAAAPEPALTAVSARAMGPSMWVPLGLAGLLALPATAHWHLHRPAVAAVQLALPAELPGGWLVDPAPSTGWRPVQVAPTARATGAYRRAEDAVEVDIAYYRQQDRERKLVSSTHVLVPQGDTLWQAQPRGEVQVPVQGQVFALRAWRLVSRSSDRPDRLVWQAYWVNGGLLADDMQARLRLAQGVISGRGDDAARLTLHTTADSTDAAQRRLLQFAQSTLPAWLAALEATRGSAR